jgi:hypothetical protein
VLPTARGEEGGEGGPQEIQLTQAQGGEDDAAMLLTHPQANEIECPRPIPEPRATPPEPSPPPGSVEPLADSVDSEDGEGAEG